MAVELDVGHPELVLPGEGEVVRETEAWRLEILCGHDPLNVTLFRIAGGENGPPLHVHHTHADAFYVLDGELTIPLGPGGEPQRLPAGSFVVAPALVAHSFVLDRGDVRFLNFHAPGAGFAAMIRAPDDAKPPFDQEAPPEGGGRPGTDATIGRGELLVDEPRLRTALLADEDQLAVSEVTSATGVAATRLHLHRRHTESFYVLAGELVLTLGDRELAAGPGTWAHVPPGVPHRFAIHDGEARFLVIHAPNCGFGGFLRAIHTGDEAALAAARARFDVAGV